MDVTYVTERVIVITFPGVNSETVYKNDLKEVGRMLKTKHGNKYAIFNFSEERTDLTKLSSQVLEFGWPYSSPPLEHLLNICKALDAWLASDTSHVAVLHCKGDKSRIGTIVQCYMNYSSLNASTDQALDRFAMRRFCDDKLFKTLQPSQKRYIDYFKSLISGSVQMKLTPCYLHYVAILGLNNFESLRGCNLFFEIYEGQKVVYSSGVYPVSSEMERTVVRFEPLLQLCGDILVKGWHQTQDHSGQMEIFSVQFHTGVTEGDRLTFTKRDLDVANYDPKFAEHGSVEFQFTSSPYDQKVSYVEGPLDGSLYATVNKRSMMLPRPQVPVTHALKDADGAHLSLDSGISSASGTYQTSPFQSLQRHYMTPSPPPLYPSQHVHKVQEINRYSSLAPRGSEVYDFLATNGDPDLREEPFGRKDVTASQLDEVLSGMIQEIQSIPDVPLFPQITMPRTDKPKIQETDTGIRHNPDTGKGIVPSNAIDLFPTPHSMINDYKENLPEHHPMFHGFSEEEKKQSAPPQGIYARLKPLSTINNQENAMVEVSRYVSAQQMGPTDTTMRPKSSSMVNLDDVPQGKIRRHSSSKNIPMSMLERYEGQQQSMSWLQKQQQKLKSRQHAMTEEEKSKERMLMELQLVQNHRVSREGEDSGVTVPDGYSSPHQRSMFSGPAYPQTGQTPLGKKVVSAPTSPVLPPRTSSRDILKKVQYWKSGHLMRQHSDLSHDRNRILTTSQYYPTSDSSGSADYDYSWSQPYQQDHQLQGTLSHRPERSSHSLSPTPQSSPLHQASRERLLPSTVRDTYPEMKPNTKPDLSEFIAGFQDYILANSDAAPMTNGSIGDVEKSSKSSSEILHSKRPLSSSHSDLSHPAWMNRQSTPVTTTHFEMRNAPSWSSSQISRRGDTPRRQTMTDISSVSSDTSFNAQYSKQESIDIFNAHPVFSKDSSKLWYKPNLTREEAILMLKDKPPGSFVIRASSSFPGAFGLALKVSTLQSSPRSKSGDAAEYVRHFLIEQTAKGVRFKGCHNEPTFGSLAALVYQHSITPLALPCKLLLPELDPKNAVQECQDFSDKDSRISVFQSRDCRVLYLGSVDMESLTGPQAVGKAVECILRKKSQTSAISVNFKVRDQGITLTDNTHKVFFRRHYAMSSISYCSTDPDNRCWIKQGDEVLSSRSYFPCFGVVARKPGSHTDNECHVFAEIDPEHPAAAIVSFINKTVATSTQERRELFA